MVGLAGSVVGVVPDGVSAVAAGKKCRPTAFVTEPYSGAVSTIDVKTKTKHPNDIFVGPGAGGMAITPDGKTAFVTNLLSGTVSTIDVKTKTKHPVDISVGRYPGALAITPDGKTTFVNDRLSGSVSTIDVKTRTRTPPTSSSARAPAWWRSRRTARPPSSPTNSATRCRRST